MAAQQNASRIFLSYAAEDEPLAAELVKHLSPLKRLGLISTWYKQQILAGTERSQIIDEHLEQAAIILLLISADFLNSDYCYEAEMKRALQRYEQGEARVVPIIVRPCNWQDSPFAGLQYLPYNGHPITTQKNRDAAWTEIVRNIRRLIETPQPERIATIREFAQLPDTPQKTGAEQKALSFTRHGSSENTSVKTEEWLRQGDDLCQRMRYKEALAAYDQAISFDPQCPRAYDGKGNALFTLGKYEKALAAFDQAISLDPHYAKAYHDKGQTLQRLGRYHEAFIAYDLARKHAREESKGN
jgi:tetratricopeptide (TPR) repeat protein